MIRDKLRLDGRVAVITGETKGLGRAIIIGMAEVGADIPTLSRSPDIVLQKRIPSLGGRYIHHAPDLRQREQTEEVIPAILNKFGNVDILINNAGIIRRSPSLDYPKNDWDDTIEIDLTAAFVLPQTAGRIMIEKGKRGNASVFQWTGAR